MARLQAEQDALLEFSTEFLLFVDDLGRLIAGAGHGLKALGYNTTERRGRHIAEHLHPSDLPTVLDLIERARTGLPEFRETLRLQAQHKDGHWMWFDATVIGVANHPVLGRGAAIRVRQTESDEPADASGPDREAADSGRFVSLAEALPTGILSADARGWVVYSNPSARQILNLPVDLIGGQGWLNVVAPEDLPDVMEAAGLVVRTGVPQQATFRIKTGLFERWAAARFVPLGGDTHRSGWIATLDDITDRRRAESQLAFQATHDPLTELPNRALLEDRLEQACARLSRADGSVAVLFVDLDDFKDINDTLGHAAGDAVLREVANRLRTVLRPADTVARIGGDEFVAVCEGMDEPMARQVAWRLGEVLAVPFLHDGVEIVPAASLGIAVTADLHADAGELLARADQSMYRQKRTRRGVSANAS